MSDYVKWHVRDTLVGTVYKMPNKLIAEKVAEMHGNCEVLPGWPEEPEYEYAIRDESPTSNHGEIYAVGISEAAAHIHATKWAHPDTVVRRRKQGEWEEVK